MNTKNELIEQAFVQDCKTRAALRQGRTPELPGVGITITIPAPICDDLRENPSPLNLGFIIQHAILQRRTTLTIGKGKSLRCPVCHNPRIDQLPHGIKCHNCGYFVHKPNTEPIKLPDYNGGRTIHYQPGHGASGGKNSR